MPLSDDDLMRQIAGQEADALEELRRRYEVALRGRMAQMTRDHAAAADLLQELWLRVWTKAADWQAQGQVRAWLYRVATNLALNHLRTVGRRREQALEALPDTGVPHAHDDDEGSPVPSWLIDGSSLGPAALAERADRCRHVRRLIDELPEAKREILRLVLDQEMDVADVSAALDLPAGTVRSRLHYATRQVRREWQELEP